MTEPVRSVSIRHGQACHVPQSGVWRTDNAYTSTDIYTKIDGCDPNTQSCAKPMPWSPPIMWSPAPIVGLAAAVAAAPTPFTPNPVTPVEPRAYGNLDITETERRIANRFATADEILRRAVDSPSDRDFHLSQARAMLKIAVGLAQDMFRAHAVRTSDPSFITSAARVASDAYIQYAARASAFGIPNTDPADAYAKAAQIWLQSARLKMEMASVVGDINAPQLLVGAFQDAAFAKNLSARERASTLETDIKSASEKLMEDLMRAMIDNRETPTAFRAVTASQIAELIPSDAATRRAGDMWLAHARTMETSGGPSREIEYAYRKAAKIYQASHPELAATAFEELADHYKRIASLRTEEGSQSMASEFERLEREARSESRRVREAVMRIPPEPVVTGGRFELVVANQEEEARRLVAEEARRARDAYIRELTSDMRQGRVSPARFMEEAAGVAGMDRDGFAREVTAHGANGDTLRQRFGLAKTDISHLTPGRPHPVERPITLEAR